MLNVKKLVIHKNRFKPRVDVHPTEKAIVIEYITEVALKDANGEIVHKETKNSQKTFHIENFTTSSDIKGITHSLLDQCSLLKLKNIANIEQSLKYLYSRKKFSDLHTENVLLPLKDPETSKRVKPKHVKLEKLRNYQELLYEPKFELKLEGSSYLLLLTRDVNNLHPLSQTPSFFTSLSRVLKDNCNGNYELSQNILHIFFIFSTYLNFHPILTEHKVGSLVYHIIDLEMKAYGQIISQLKQKLEDEKEKKRLLSLVSEQDKLMKVAFYFVLNLANDPRTEAKMFNKGICQLLLRVLGSRENEEDLSMVLLTFLIKFTLKQEGKNELVENNAVVILRKIIQSDNDSVVSLGLVVIFNLSFDSQFITEAVNLHRYIHHLVPLLKKESTQFLALKILYQMSCHANLLEKFNNNDLFKFLSGQILNKDNDLEDESHRLVRAILINILYQKENAESFASEKLTKKLLDKAISTKDALLMKILRVISAHNCLEIKMKFLHFVESLVHIVTNLELFPQFSPEEDRTFKVECLGVLGNLRVPRMNYFKIFDEFGLFPWVEKWLIDSTKMAGVNVKAINEDSQDDILLEVVKLLSFACLDAKVAERVIKLNIVKLLVKILNYKQEDDQIVFHIVSVFFMLFSNPSTRHEILKDNDVLAYLMDLMSDPNEKIKNITDQSLDVIAETNPVYASTIQANRFTSHNRHWLKVINENNEDDIY